MSVFEHVTVTREANIYFDGKVTSRTITFADGTTKTLGIIQPGEYTFTTAAAELMEIISGASRCGSATTAIGARCRAARPSRSLPAPRSR